MADKINGTILQMRALSPLGTGGPINGQIWKSRETSEPRRESIFAWDPTPYDGPLYFNPDVGENEVPQYIGFTPNIENLRDGSAGVWRWVDPPRGSIDAERVYGVSAKESAGENAIRLQRCIDEVLASDQTWPREPFDPGEGDSWIVHLPAGTIRLQPPPGESIVFNRKTHDTAGCDPGEEKITVAGRIRLKGQGLTTRLSYESDPGQDAFKVGGAPDEIWEPGCVFRHLGQFGLHDLELQAATHAGFAVLRIQQASGGNIFESVKITQYGNGDGVNANEVVFNRFSQFVVQRLKDTARYPNPLPSSGRGLWVHTDNHPYYISGQLVLDRVSVFGEPHNDVAQYHFFDTGILLGGNQSPDRLLGSVTGQFINAEICQDGIVFGKGAVNVDFSVVWVESNQKAGVRFIDGAQNIRLCQTYAFQSAPRVPPTFEGEIVFGKKGGTAAENSCRGITLDGIFQNFQYGPAVRFYNGTGAIIRDIKVRNIFVGLPYTGLLPPSGPDKGAWPPDAQGIQVPTAKAVVELGGGTYDGLVIESIRPADEFATFPVNTAGKRVLFIDKPELVDKLVYSGPYDAPWAYGVYETQGPTVARRGLTHASNYTIKHNDPMYHRVDTTTSDPLAITLPRIKRALTNEGAMTPDDRVGLEYHISWIGGFGPNRSLVVQSNEKIFGHPFPAGRTEVYPLANFARILLRSVSEPGGAPHWEILESVDVG